MNDLRSVRACLTLVTTIALVAASNGCVVSDPSASGTVAAADLCDLDRTPCADAVQCSEDEPICDDGFCRPCGPEDLFSEGMPSPEALDAAMKAGVRECIEAAKGNRCDVRTGRCIDSAQTCYCGGEAVAHDPLGVVDGKAYPQSQLAHASNTQFDPQGCTRACIDACKAAFPQALALVSAANLSLSRGADPSLRISLKGNRCQVHLDPVCSYYVGEGGLAALGTALSAALVSPTPEDPATLGDEMGKFPCTELTYDDKPRF